MPGHYIAFTVPFYAELHAQFVQIKYMTQAIDTSFAPHLAEALTKVFVCQPEVNMPGWETQSLVCNTKIEYNKGRYSP